MQLSELKIGQSGVVVSIDDPDLAYQLMRVGLLPGDFVVVNGFAPFNGPVAVKVNGVKLALRKHHTFAIQVERKDA